MSVHGPIHPAPKSLAEGAACFACALAALTAAALGLQWLMGLLS